MATKQSMTVLRLRVLRFFEDYYKQHRFPPSFGDVGEALEIDSMSVIKYAVDRLIEDEYLYQGMPGLSRTIVPTFKQYKEFQKE